MPQVEVDKRVLLSSVQTLTFFSDAETQGRRTRPIPQLTCKGSSCKLYQPYAVTCKNIGGRGINVKWRCDADLPSSLRFRKIDVNCEGWSRTGDQFVLEGSCGLTYELIKLPSSLRDDQSGRVYGPTSAFSATNILGIAALVALLLYLISRCYGSARRAFPSTWNPFTSTAGSGSTNNPPPPPYTSAPPPHFKSSDSSDPTWRPGFWSGLGLGSAASYLWTNRNSRRSNDGYTTENGNFGGPRSRAYDWERPRSAGGSFGGAGGQGQSSSFQTRYAPPDEGSSWAGSRARNTDRGEGTSNLGPMRSASGIGRSTVR